MYARHLPHARAIRTAGTGVVVALAVAACGSGSSGGGTSDASGDARHAVVTISEAAGCAISATTFPAGALTFEVTNKDANAVSEVELVADGRIVGEKENLPPGFSGSFAVHVDGGKYEVLCPGAKPDSVSITVTGKATASGGTVAQLLKQGATEYAAYVTDQATELVAAAARLRDAIKGGNLSDAQAAYDKARPFYEKIEPVAESFTAGKDNLDADIDARAGDVPAAQWKGFHRIEKGLFADQSVRGLAPYASGLVANTKKLRKLTVGLTFQPYEIANGAQELLDEVAASKITGEEERYSHIDLVDIENNEEGAEQAFAALRSGLAKIDNQLTSTIAARFAALDALVETYRTGDNPSGFVYYGELSKSDKRKLAAAVKAVQEPLSKVASKVASV
jgi:iron uptake system component EfeO